MVGTGLWKSWWAEGKGNELCCPNFLALGWVGLAGLVDEVGASDKDSTREAWQPCTQALPNSISEQEI